MFILRSRHNDDFTQHCETKVNSTDISKLLPAINTLVANAKAKHDALLIQYDSEAHLLRFSTWSKSLTKSYFWLFERTQTALASAKSQELEIVFVTIENWDMVYATDVQGQMYYVTGQQQFLPVL